jgi:6-phosphofructokinase 2
MTPRPNVVTLTFNPALDVSTTTDRVAPVHKLRCAPPRFDPGGGGINVARVLHRLGEPTLAAFPAGGCTGERLTGLLRDEGAPCAPTAIPGETRESFNVVSTADAAEYRFILPGPEVAEADLARCIEQALDRVAVGGVVVASGGLPPNARPSILGDLAAACRTAGVRLAVDTSRAPLAAALAAGVHLVKPNLRELSEHLARDLPDTPSRLAACRHLISAGSAVLVALSLSQDGALLVSGEEAWFAPAAPIRPLSTVGAGDSFLAGLLWAIEREMSLADALRYGAAAGAASLMSPGAGLCQPPDVFDLALRITAVRVD